MPRDVINLLNIVQFVKYAKVLLKIQVLIVVANSKLDMGISHYRFCVWTTSHSTRSDSIMVVVDQLSKMAYFISCCDFWCQ